MTQIVQQRIDMTKKKVQMRGDIAQESHTKKMNQQTINLINLMSKFTITVILSDIATILLIIGVILLLTKGMLSVCMRQQNNMEKTDFVSCQIKQDGWAGIRVKMDIYICGKIQFNGFLLYLIQLSIYSQ